MQVEFLIVGQGISGTFLSYYLSKKDKSFLVIDDQYKYAPSRIAAGIINPVTGRRMVTVWMADEVIPFAKSAYEEIGGYLGITAITQRNIIDFFPNPFMRENFLKRLNEGNTYLESIPDDKQFEEIFNYEFGCGEIRPVYTAHLENLLPVWRNKLVNEKYMQEESFDIAKLHHSDEGISYKDIRAEKIIFCDGAAGVGNPFFKQLPFAPNKGEVLLIEIPGINLSHLFKKSMTLAPMPALGKDIYWIGSNYIWDFDTIGPTQEFRNNTEKILKEWLKIPFKVLEHRVGIRPATLERRPFVGFHPIHNNIGILNGMGTKGCSLAPYFAKQLTDHLADNIAITPEADVMRFQKALLRK